MPSAKKEGHIPSSKSIGKRALEELKKIAAPLASKEWIDTHDELLDKSVEAQITVEDLFTKHLIHKTFSHGKVGSTPFDWSEFRQALEIRNATSPRWFIQLREEDLLLGPHGLDGVKVDCFVVVEAKAPTFSPAEYIVKVHWPYSDAEDNAPERILSISQQGMCWKQVVKNNGEDINVYLLQKRSAGTSAAASEASGISFGLGLTSSASIASSSSSSSPPVGFSFGASTSAPPSTTVKSLSSDAQGSATSFGFGSLSPSSGAVQPTVFSFGFSSAPPSTASIPANFGFGSAATSDQSLPSLNPSFSFGNISSASSPSYTEHDSPEVPIKSLKTSEILFCLWSRNRLEEMKKEILSGSRIVREGFKINPTTSVKLVMQNDVEDDVKGTAYRLILRDIFAKSNSEMGKIKQWINDCPVYDENLVNALQEFRERRLTELANESDKLDDMIKEFQPRIEEEFQRIIQIRRNAAQLEIDMIEFILERMKRKLLLEKSEFRLLKYYAKNDILPFRPFGKISGISEMGEAVDVCVPPAHVNINPFTQQ